MKTDMIEKVVIDLSYDPFDADKNFAAAVEYEKLGQTGAAISFYLRAAEYSNKQYDPVVYSSLLKLAHCFEHQKDRLHTVSNCILQAIAYDPKRPEAYFLMSRFHEKANNWQESYSFAEIGLACGEFMPLPIYVEYPGRYGLLFEKAVSAWWIGRKQESIDLFNELLDKHNMDDGFISACINNLKRIS